MEPNKPSSDAFGTFLENMQRSTKQSVSQAQDRSLPLTIVTMIREAGPMPVAELIRSSGLSFREVTSAVLELQDAGFIELRGQAGQEVAQLTPTGASLASLAAAK